MNDTSDTRFAPGPPTLVRAELNAAGATTKHYSDGSSATGGAGLPDHSPAQQANLLDYRDRVRSEYADLVERANKLGDFTVGKVFRSLAIDEQERLIKQQRLMFDLAGVLAQRIAAFPA